MSESTPAQPTHWRRAIRPLLWWSLMVLLMFAYRTHERLSENTHIIFEPTLAGKSLEYESIARLDGKLVSSGQRVSIGWHTLTFAHPKTKSFSTNLFVWYGKRDLGQLTLERAMGTLVVNASPVAQRVVIRGPEFLVTLTNTIGITSSVPTDAYMVEATYKYWIRRDEVAVVADQRAVQKFAPQMGMLQIEASHQDAVFQLLASDRRLLDAGKLPATVNELPEGNYRLISTRKADQREISVHVTASMTNNLRVEFLYGMAVLESEPAGAMVYSGRSELGVTPLMLPELKPGTFAFTLQLNDHESVTSSLAITANQTNGFRTNLVSRFYTRAMERANRLYVEKSFELAAVAATEALMYKTNDFAAQRLQCDATGHAHLAQAEQFGRQGDFIAAIKAANAAIESLDESVDAKTLLADLTKRKQDQIEAEKKRQTELAEQKRKQEESEQAARQRQQNINRLGSRFYELNRTYSNAETFSRHELITTNEAQSVATKINSALVGGQPAFEIVKYEWPQADTFTIQARQRIGVGYRECLIVGGNAQPGEMHILFKIFEYENPPELKLLNGFLSATTSIKITSQDPQVEQRKTEKFQERVKEGLKLVESKIQNATWKDSGNANSSGL